MPMFKGFVPRGIQPWLYVLMAITFQLSGGVYLGALSHMVGGLSLMREDLLMCLYANLAGMALHFTLLFRMKFRFTNKTLLTAAATGVLLCNLMVPHISFLPLLWVVCYIEGVCKIQGTFECMSNIQLWMTPKRDFTVFFPLLHIIILGSMQMADLITTWQMVHYHWTYMHLFVSGLMIADLVLLTTCVRHFHFLPRRMPLFAIDWLGMVMWAVLLLEVAYLLNYGEWYDWWNSPVMCRLTVGIFITAALCVWRMLSIRHPFLEPAMWRYRRFLPLLAIVTIVEAFLATERVLEEVFYEEIMHYEDMTSASVDFVALAGIVVGCLFPLWWMARRHYNYIRLIAVGFAALAAYHVLFYLNMDAGIHLSQVFPAVMCRSFAYAVLSATLMVCLEEVMTFQHFFQGLTVFNMLHMVVGGVMGGAVYGRALNYYMADNIARYGADVTSVSLAPQALPHFMEPFVTAVMEVSLKQIYGWVAYACIFLLLLLMLYDAPVRSSLKKMPSWAGVAKRIKRIIK